MPLYQKLPEGLDEVDVIIAGGGTAACIVASRLAAADPHLSILVIESGKNNYQDASVINPAFFLEHLQPENKRAIFYKTMKSEALAGREVVVPSGGILGGGSSINLMMYTRAQASDFDSWKSPGWSAKELLPYLKKLETYHGAGNSSVHGYDGPVHISDGGYRAVRPERDFITAAAKVGYPEIKDLQDLESNNGFSRWMRTVSKDGKRQDTAHTYLHPLLQDGEHPNLHVLVESRVVRVLFDEQKRACGVEYTPNPDFQPEINNTPHPKSIIKARTLVVVSCGACGTPSILERSGIGSAEVLRKASVPLVVDLPGVGQNYQDHHLMFIPYRTSLQPHETNDALLSGRLNRDAAIAANDPILRWNAVDVGSKIRPTDAEATALGKEFEDVWNRDFKNRPERPLMLMALANGFFEDRSGGGSNIPDGQYVSTVNYTAYPYSRGSIHIRGPEVTDAPEFHTGFFSDAHDIDLKKHMWAYKKQREIMRRTDMYEGELEIGHPKFPIGSKAACVDLSTSGSSDYHKSLVENLEYSAGDDKAIEQFLREKVGTTYHSLGTAKMAPRDQMGVVDTSLSVYGVHGLKVVDMGIVPENVGANTNNTAMVVGEKAADIIAREL
ncbi:Alcohol oxidase, partial [Lachnellula suecica]